MVAENKQFDHVSALDQKLEQDMLQPFVMCVWVCEYVTESYSDFALDVS